MFRSRDRRVGYVFQDGRLFPHLDVRANLVYGARSSMASGWRFRRVVALLELAPMLDAHAHDACRAASASASRSGARCSRSRARCCSTSR